MTSVGQVLDAIRGRISIDQPAMVLVAHPDDEVLGLSVLLSRFTDLTLVHATDGAAGGNPDERQDELGAALKALGVNVRRHVKLDLPDGRLTANLAQFLDRLSAIWDDHELIVTHAYEGGHPDHDCCAVAVNTLRHAISDKLTLAFPIYALGAEGVAKNRFIREPAYGIDVALSATERDAKRRALAEFVSQAHVVAAFDLNSEAVGSADVFDPSIVRDASGVLFARGDQSVCNAWHDTVVAGLMQFSAESKQP